MSTNTDIKQDFKKPRQWKAFFVMLKYFFLAQTRNPATFAFGFLFPVVFISIFGLIGNGSQKVTVGVPRNTNSIIISTLKKQQFVTIQEGSMSSLKTELIQGKIGGIVSTTQTQENPLAYTVSILTSSASPQNAGIVQGVVRGIVDQTNLQLSGVVNPPYTATVQEVSGRNSRYIDFALPGQIGFSLLSTAIFGTVFGLIFLKKSLVLKRMFATPTKARTI